eukprot:scaffold282318_cov30-Tisochrysis_lutea.AAC.1
MSADAAGVNAGVVDVTGPMASPARMRAASHAYGVAGLTLTSSFSHPLSFTWIACSSKYFCSSSVLAAL